MDTEVISLAKMKTEAGRNLDADVNATTLIAGEKADGTFGVFNFFQGIKNFFKGISALGTLASGSRLPVTDSNGNVTYTTMNDINSYVINNALTDYVGKGKTIYPTEYATNLNDIAEVFKKSKLVTKYTTNMPSGLPTLSGSAYGYVDTVPLSNDNNARVKQELYISDNPDGTVWRQFHYIRFRVDGVWLGWQKVATGSDLNNYEDIEITTTSNTTSPLGYYGSKALDVKAKKPISAFVVGSSGFIGFCTFFDGEGVNNSQIYLWAKKADTFKVRVQYKNV